MSIVQIYGWKGIAVEKKKQWIQECTAIMADAFDESLDEITVFINEIPSENWGQAGAIGTDEDWLIKSRLTTRVEEENASN